MRRRRNTDGAARQSAFFSESEIETDPTKRCAATLGDKRCVRTTGHDGVHSIEVSPGDVVTIDLSRNERGFQQEVQVLRREIEAHASEDVRWRNQIARAAGIEGGDLNTWEAIWRRVTLLGIALDQKGSTFFPGGRDAAGALRQGMFTIADLLGCPSSFTDIRKAIRTLQRQLAVAEELAEQRGSTAHAAAAFRKRMHDCGPEGFMPCTREWPHDGPCAHPTLDESRAAFRSGGDCPDGGACHHGCTMICWRVSNAEPLSGAGYGAHWPAEIQAEHAAYTPPPAAPTEYAAAQAYVGDDDHAPPHIDRGGRDTRAVEPTAERPSYLPSHVSQRCTILSHNSCSLPGCACPCHAEPEIAKLPSEGNVHPAETLELDHCVTCGKSERRIKGIGSPPWHFDPEHPGQVCYGRIERTTYVAEGSVGRQG